MKEIVIPRKKKSSEDEKSDGDTSSSGSSKLDSPIGDGDAYGVDDPDLQKETKGGKKCVIL